ncbi:hypothetical protein HMPREF9445_02847 [Bacteroides clarus YIT 12056]|uniref:Uncharacterized protein n=1 Tax=Bacteroides clarus YIT 12056 TaxID=762984 RepID=A0ABN0CJM6_9BACE|nr:hypothetical protein HMPREF9445_02847 [Bacteroides clarus YIT 12056]
MFESVKIENVPKYSSLFPYIFLTGNSSNTNRAAEVSLGGSVFI